MVWVLAIASVALNIAQFLLGQRRTPLTKDELTTWSRREELDHYRGRFHQAAIRRIDGARYFLIKAEDAVNIPVCNEHGFDPPIHICRVCGEEVSVADEMAQMAGRIDMQVDRVKRAEASQQKAEYELCGMKFKLQAREEELRRVLDRQAKERLLHGLRNSSTELVQKIAAEQLAAPAHPRPDAKPCNDCGYHHPGWARCDCPDCGEPVGLPKEKHAPGCRLFDKE